MEAKPVEEYCALNNPFYGKRSLKLTLYSTLYNRATVSNKSFISARGYSGFSAASGRTRSQAHFCVNSGDSSPSSICRIYLPSTGKNL